MLNPVNINMSQVAWVLVVIVLIVILIKIL